MKLSGKGITPSPKAEERRHFDLNFNKLYENKIANAVRESSSPLSGMAGTIFHHSSFHFPYSFLSKKPAVSIMLQTFPRFCGSNLDLNFQNGHSILRDSLYKFLNTLLVLAHQAVANQEFFTLGYARAAGTIQITVGRGSIPCIKPPEILLVF
jgi:hypothetical protein